MPIYSSGAVGQLYNVSRETVRQWAIEYGFYMSPGATPEGKGVQRKFTDDDLEIFALISASKRAGLSADSIHLALQDGQRGDIPDNIDRVDQKAITRTQVTSLHKQLVALKEAVEDLRKDVQRRDAQVELLQQQLEAAQRRIDQLNREIGRLEAGQGD